MTVQEFIAACEAASRKRNWPDNWQPLQKALAFDRAGDWDLAHGIAQDDPSILGSAVHAYLHREEGVQWNAEYWYGRAGRPPYTGSLDEEWEALASELIG